MDSAEMKERTKALALRIVRLVGALPNGRTSDVLARQLLRAGTSIRANYREALHASTRRQFASTLEIAQREAAETVYWLELIGESGLVQQSKLADLVEECNQIYAILTSTIRSAKNHRSKVESPNPSNHQS